MIERNDTREMLSALRNLGMTNYHIIQGTDSVSWRSPYDAREYAADSWDTFCMRLGEMVLSGALKVRGVR